MAGLRNFSFASTRVFVSRQSVVPGRAFSARTASRFAGVTAQPPRASATPPLRRSLRLMAIIQPGWNLLFQRSQESEQVAELVAGELGVEALRHDRDLALANGVHGGARDPL